MKDRLRIFLSIKMRKRWLAQLYPLCFAIAGFGITNITMAETDIGFDSIQFSSNSYFASEQDGQVRITVTRTGSGIGAASVQMMAGGMVDTASFADYSMPASNILSWADGDLTDRTLTISLVADSLVEGDETLTLFLQPPQLQELAVTGRAAHIVGGIDTTPAILTIQDSTINPSAAQRLRTISGNFQEGISGDTLAPFVITAVTAAGIPVDAVTINWEVLPSNGGSLAQLTTVTNASGLSNNTLVLNTSDRLVVKATIDTSQIGGAVGITDVPAVVIFVVNGGLADTAGLTPNQKSVATALDSACPALLALGNGRSAKQDDLLATCTSLGNGTPAEVAASLDLLAHEEVTAQGRVILETGKAQSTILHRRLADLRNGSRGVSLAGLKINIDGQTLPSSVISALFGNQAQGGSAGEESSGIASPWGTFINATIIAGDRDKTTTESGFDYRSEGVTIGADYRVSDQLVVGSALGYASKTSDFKSSTGDMDIDNWHMSAYGSYYRSDSFYIDGLFRLGSNDIDTRRQINLPGDPLQEGIGETSGWEYAISVSSGYEFSQGPLTLGPYGRLGYIQTSIDSYTESASNPGGMGAGSVLSIENQNVDSLTGVLGGQITYAISASNSVYLLQLNTEWEHEFNDDSRAIAAQFAYDPTRTSFDIFSDSPDRNYFNLGLGVTAVFANGRSGFLRYESRLGQSEVSQYWINAGIRIEL